MVAVQAAYDAVPVAEKAVVVHYAGVAEQGMLHGVAPAPVLAAAQVGMLLHNCSLLYYADMLVEEHAQKHVVLVL